ncbi:FAD-binding protein [Amycolatopsis sp. YIM 10]|uniref:FAD-binding protein n=1 Tax=Amycolatopsis sp. YIM 10 TaxID=2653857 RepID=UPI0012905933|nr:FAD-binding protein [Amycolatopsis sp. YIM 10]QFU90208.1 putative oxidoreductase ORF5 in fasciation locus [Amycolatopsis sp. YIM 10]
MTIRPDSAGTAVVGFDPVDRRWLPEPEATSLSFATAPELDGELLVDPAARDAAATDLGNIADRRPCAVLRPGSADDVAAMIRFCRAYAITVSTRGQAHTTYGQALSAGLVIETRYLDRIHSLGPELAEVDAGILWKDLVTAAFEHSRTPPAVTGYTALTVGGTLSMGGLGGLVGGLRSGLQVDHVRELEVVTGAGEIERCSPGRNPELFEAVLGGLGQCGVITKAVVELVPARERARTYVLGYTDNAAFFRDLHEVIDRPGIDHVYAELYPPGADPTHKLYATVFYNEGTPPNDEAATGGLSVEPVVDDTGYLDYVFSIDTFVDDMRENVSWDRLLKPWYDVWLPGSAIENYVAEVHPALTPRDIGPYGISLIYPQRRKHLTRPYPRVPEPDGSSWVFVLDLNTTSAEPGPDPVFVEEMLDRNARMFSRARDEFGAVLYPIGSVRFTAEDWRTHYGERWPAFCAAKTKFDPGGVLCPGPGIFPNN